MLSTEIWTPTGVILIIGAVTSGIGTIIGVVNSGKIASTKTELQSVKKTGEAIHTLSNSAMGAQILSKMQVLKNNAIMAHRLYEITKQDADLISAKAIDVQVEAAQTEYSTHQAKQAVIDAKVKEGT